MTKPISDELRHKLVTMAQAAQKLAYAEYSKFRVGAALLAADGQVFTGCNVENASYGGTICAERTAYVKAVSEGQRKFEAIAVVSPIGVSPCGMCRQFMAEFGMDVIVIMADESGKILDECTLRDLLPRSFGPEHLDH